MFYFPTRNRFVLFAITKKRTETIIKSLLCNSRLARHLSNADDENVRQFNVLMRISRSSYFTFRIFVRFPLESLLNSLWMTVWCCVVHVVRVQRNSPRVVSKHTRICWARFAYLTYNFRYDGAHRVNSRCVALLFIIWQKEQWDLNF